MTGLAADQIDHALLVALPAVLDVPAAAALRQRLLADAQPGQVIRLDAAAVVQMTTPAVQMLLAAADFIRRKRARLVLANPSDALVAAFGDLGLFSQLMAWEAE